MKTDVSAMDDRGSNRRNQKKIPRGAGGSEDELGRSKSSRMKDRAAGYTSRRGQKRNTLGGEEPPSLPRSICCRKQVLHMKGIQAIQHERFRGQRWFKGDELQTPREKKKKKKKRNG